jgi:hypothetical protein
MISGSTSFIPIIEASQSESLLGRLSTLPTQFGKLLPGHVPKHGSGKQKESHIPLLIIRTGNDVMDQR